jgi:hypothetical protein
MNMIPHFSLKNTHNGASNRLHYPTINGTRVALLHNKPRVVIDIYNDNTTTSMEHKMKRIILLALVAVLVGSVSFAQTATPKVTKRQHHQQQRIKEGVKSGELTKGEAARLEAQQGKIAVDKAKAKSDGAVTPAERAKLKREQDRASKKIYRKKHNAKEAK